MYARTMTAGVLVLWLLVGPGFQSPPTAPDATLVRVFLETDDSGHPDELASRRESLQHLAAALAKRRKVFTIVDAEDQADVTIEILGRGLTVPRVIFGGATTTTGQRPSPMPAPTRVVQVQVKLSADRVTDPIELRNKNRPVESEPGWKSAADDIAKQIEKWATDHRRKIIEARR
jgi:hypothetical protein